MVCVVYVVGIPRSSVVPPPPLYLYSTVEDQHISRTTVGQWERVRVWVGRGQCIVKKYKLGIPWTLSLCGNPEHTLDVHVDVCACVCVHVCVCAQVQVCLSCTASLSGQCEPTTLRLTIWRTSLLDSGKIESCNCHVDSTKV